MHILVLKLPQEMKGKTLACTIDNQSPKAVMESKGSTRVIALNSIGKQIYWLQQRGEFALRLDYFKSKGNIADIFTRQSPGLEASHSAIYFKKLWDAFGPFQWDLMATFANANKDAQKAPLKFFSR